MFEHHFSRFSSRIADWAGSPVGFVLALLTILLWAFLGPILGYSELWQLAINTGTTIVTFLMVFLIQNSQNRDTRAIQIKIDELIRATKGASNALMDLENMSASEIQDLHERYCKVAERAKALGYEFDLGSPKLPPEPVKEAKAGETAEAAAPARKQASRRREPAKA